MEWTPADEMRMIAACRASRGAASVAQLDRVLPSEGRGRGFESRRMRHLLSFSLIDADALTAAITQRPCLTFQAGPFCVHTD